jgi:phage shock protein A
MADEHLLRRKVTENRAAEADYLAKAGGALNKGREDLARASVERALTHQQLAASFAEQLADETVQVERLKSALAKLEGKLSEARAKSELLATRHRRARAVSRTAQSRAAVAADGPEAAFGRMKDKVDREEAIGAAHAELARASLDDELLALGREEEVDRILNDIRSKKLLA